MKKIFILLFVLAFTNVRGQVNVINSSSYDTKQVEGIVSLSAKLLNVDSVLIIVKDMPVLNSLSIKIEFGLKVGSCVVPENGNYSLYIRSGLDKYELQKELIHEMIHVYQYYNNDLKYISTGIVEFRGEVINLKKVSYNKRPFEIEAVKMEYGIQLFILNTIAKNK